MQDAIHEAFARRYNSDPADPACATDLAVYSAGWRDAQPTQAPVLDDRWKARLLDGRALERDEIGMGEHPDLPWLDEGTNPPKFFESLGMQLAGRSAEDELDMDAYDSMSGSRNLEVYDFNGWTPSRPDGDGWCLVSIHDTEDGPVAWWLRKLPHGAIVRSRRRAGERDDLTAEECREYLSSGWTRVRGRAERALVQQISQLLDTRATPVTAVGPAWDKTRDSLSTLMRGFASNLSHDQRTAWAVLDAATAPDMPLAYLRGAAPALEAPATPDTRWCPDKCPITGRPFFMWIKHYETGVEVPTYGGPFDSYTLPVKGDDGIFECERYDHDAGEWMTEGMGWCDLSAKLVDDQAFVVAPDHPRYNEIEAFAAAAPQAPAAPLGMVHVLPTVIRKLIEELNKASPGNTTTAKAEDYLKLHALRMQALGAATAATAELSQAERDVLAERRRQVSAEGFSHARDDQYVGGQLAGAATSYLILAAGGREDEARAFWPWRQEWLKPGSPRRYLEKVGALVLAEMERLDRAAAQNGGAA